MINDLDSLKATIEDWLKRADLAPAIPTFISLAEARINRTLFVRERIKEDAGQAVSGIHIPDDLDRVIAFQVLRGDRWVPLAPAPANAPLEMSGAANSYQVAGNLIYLSGPNEVTYRLTYYARIPPLSDSSPQNWLLSKEPGLYLYGALIEATPYIQDDERTAIWATQFQTILDDCIRSDEYARFGNAPAMVVSGHATP